MFEYSLIYESGKIKVGKESYEASLLLEQLIGECLIILKQNGFEFELNSDEKEPGGIILSTDATIKEDSISTKIGLKCCERLISVLGGSIQTYTQ